MVFQNGNWTNFKEFKTLQHVRLITGTRQYDHIKPALQKLHWLPLGSRIIFKVILITFKILHGLSPAYLLRSCYKNIIHHVVYVHPPNHFLLSPLCQFCDVRSTYLFLLCTYITAYSSQFSNKCNFPSGL